MKDPMLRLLLIALVFTFVGALIAVCLIMYAGWPRISIAGFAVPFMIFGVIIGADKIDD